MDPTSSIRKLGFQKWYERELIKSHAALVTCFLCGLLIAALMEQITGTRFDWRHISMLVIVFCAGIIGWGAWRSYITILCRAEFYGERSSCPQCKTWARFKIVDSGVDSVPGAVAARVAPLEAAWLRVECRQCGAGWRLPE